MSHLLILHESLLPDPSSRTPTSKTNPKSIKSTPPRSPWAAPCDFFPSPRTHPLASPPHSPFSTSRPCPSFIFLHSSTVFPLFLCSAKSLSLFLATSIAAICAFHASCRARSAILLRLRVRNFLQLRLSRMNQGCLGSGG